MNLYISHLTLCPQLYIIFQWLHERIIPFANRQVRCRFLIGLKGTSIWGFSSPNNSNFKEWSRNNIEPSYSGENPGRKYSLSNVSNLYRGNHLGYKLWATICWPTDLPNWDLFRIFVITIITWILVSLHSEHRRVDVLQIQGYSNYIHTMKSHLMPYRSLRVRWLWCTGVPGADSGGRH